MLYESGHSALYRLAHGKQIEISGLVIQSVPQQFLFDFHIIRIILDFMISETFFFKFGIFLPRRRIDSRNEDFSLFTIVLEPNHPFVKDFAKFFGFIRHFSLKLVLVFFP